MVKFKLNKKKLAWKSLGEKILDKKNINYVSTEVGKSSVCQDTERMQVMLKHNAQGRTGRNVA